MIGGTKTAYAEELSYIGNSFPYEKHYYFMDSQYQDYTIVIDFNTTGEGSRIYWGITVEYDVGTDFTDYYKFVSVSESRITFTVKEILDNCLIEDPTIILRGENSTYIEKIQVLSPEELDALNKPKEEIPEDKDDQSTEEEDYEADNSGVDNSEAEDSEVNNSEAEDSGVDNSEAEDREVDNSETEDSGVDNSEADNSGTDNSEADNSAIDNSTLDKEDNEISSNNSDYSSTSDNNIVENQDEKSGDDSNYTNSELVDEEVPLLGSYFILPMLLIPIICVLLFTKKNKML